MICTKRTYSSGLILALGVGLFACSNLPQTSRTAAIHDVEIEEKLSADNILVQPGDEVRWINLRRLPAQVDIPNLKSEDVSCQRGFTNWLGTLGETVNL